MKKTNLILLFAALIMLGMSACEKDNNDDNNNGGGDEPKEVFCYLQKEVHEDGSYFQISYNDEDKVIRAEDFDSLGNSLGSYSTFAYSSGKLSVMEAFEEGTLVAKFEYVYDSEGKIDKADLYSDMGSGFTKLGYVDYTYSGDHLASYSMVLEMMGQSVPYLKQEYAYTGDNVTRVDHYELGAQATLEKIGHSEYEYDNAKNPYRGGGLNDVVVIGVETLNENNYTKVSVFDAQGELLGGDSETVTYEYNAENYPVKQSAVSFDDNYSEESVFEYECK